MTRMTYRQCLLALPASAVSTDLPFCEGLSQSKARRPFGHSTDVPSTSEIRRRRLNGLARFVHQVGSDGKNLLSNE
jgi:hypothetical protein